MSNNETNHAAFAGKEEDDEDDYMKMAIPESVVPRVKETYTQRRIRKEREAEITGRTQSKSEREAAEKIAREAALSKSILPDSTAKGNKGLKMMTKMGYTPGAALGKRGGEGDLEPVKVSMKEDRGGIGLDTERKRKLREETEFQAKKVKAEEGDYRERIRRDREGKRHESQVQAAMRVAERLSESKKTNENEFSLGNDTSRINTTVQGRAISTTPLKSINVLWRGLVREREENERISRMRYDLHQSLPQLPRYADSNEDGDDRTALGKQSIEYVVADDLDEEDIELDAFNHLTATERLQQLVAYLRVTHFYCFWCKHAYSDRDLSGCPGLTEEDHD